MAINTAARNNLNNNSAKKDYWPQARLATTLIFFYLVGGNLWTGTTCYVGISALTIACPLGVVQVLAATRSFIPFLAIAGLFGIGLVVFFGRAFCSWICPGRWVFNKGPKSSPIPPKIRDWTQRALIGGVVTAAYFCQTPIFCVICPLGLVCRGAIALGTGGSVLPSIGWMGVLVGVEWTSGRSWCRDLCPLGAAISQLSKLNPFLKFKANSDSCVPCNICERACPEGLNLSKSPEMATCTKCFACQPACPRDAIELKLIGVS